MEFERTALTEDAFCGFAKPNVEVTSKSRDIVHITDIKVVKEPSEESYDTRVRFVPQGGSNAIRPLCNLDVEGAVLTTDLAHSPERARGYFQRRSRISIPPGGTETLLLGFVAVECQWAFNCVMEYSIRGKTRTIDSLFPENQVIVPYLPDDFEHDYCGFIMRVAPESHGEFQDAAYFGESMRKSRADCREASSILDYLQRLLDMWRHGAFRAGRGSRERRFADPWDGETRIRHRFGARDIRYRRHLPA